jgi:hypothetical protein
LKYTVIIFTFNPTFEYWVFDPLLGLMINTMKVLFNAESLGLTEAIFGVDKHFDQLFSEIIVTLITAAVKIGIRK